MQACCHIPRSFTYANKKAHPTLVFSFLISILVQNKNNAYPTLSYMASAFRKNI